MRSLGITPAIVVRCLYRCVVVVELLQLHSPFAHLLIFHGYGPFNGSAQCMRDFGLSPATPVDRPRGSTAQLYCPGKIVFAHIPTISTHDFSYPELMGHKAT